MPNLVFKKSSGQYTIFKTNLDNYETKNVNKICLLEGWLSLPPSLLQLVRKTMGTYNIAMVTMKAVYSSISFPLYYFIDICSETGISKNKDLRMEILSGVLLNSLLSNN